MKWIICCSSSVGCRNALVNVEARHPDSTMLTRKCLVTRLLDFTVDKYKELMAQNAGGVLILLPEDLTKLSSEDREVRLQLYTG